MTRLRLSVALVALVLLMSGLASAQTPMPAEIEKLRVQAKS